MGKRKQGARWNRKNNNKEGLYSRLRYASTIVRRNGTRRLEICKNNSKE